MSSSPGAPAIRHLASSAVAGSAAASSRLSDVLARSPHRSSASPAAAGDFVPPVPTRRDRLWELSTNLHCSIIGTCLTTSDLRSFLIKIGDPAARTGSDHALHGQAVGRARRKEEGGKLLHKLMDRRHEREVVRFGRARTVGEVRDLWREAVGRGEIPGAYWAVLTHPLTDHALVQEAFGEVHMLSHLVGRSVRADLRRLAELEAEVGSKADTIAEQEGRIGALTDEKVELVRRLAASESRTRASAADAGQASIDAVRDRDATISRLRDQLRRAEAHASAEGERRETAERALRGLADEIRLGAERETDLRAERDALEQTLANDLDLEQEKSPPRGLDGLKLLYVGGRPRQVAQARLLVARRGGHLLTHDGGADDSPILLAGLVAQADAVLFPVDCVSHDAVGTIKRSCRERDTPFRPLRSASLAGLVAAIDTLRR